MRDFSLYTDADVCRGEIIRLLKLLNKERGKGKKSSQIYCLAVIEIEKLHAYAKGLEFQNIVKQKI